VSAKQTERDQPFAVRAESIEQLIQQILNLRFGNAPSLALPRTQQLPLILCFY